MNTSSQMSWRPQPRLGSSKVLGLPALAGLSRWWRRPCAVESLFANCELAEWVTCVRPHFDARGTCTRKLKPMSAAPHGLLSSIGSPQDLRKLTPDQLEELSGEIRSFLIENVCQTGGHLGPNLGVIELTLAMHRVFDSPRDPIIFDTGHQSYVHKILTGRQDQFRSLRQLDGLSGYPSQAESEHDWV